MKSTENKKKEKTSDGREMAAIGRGAKESETHRGTRVFRPPRERIAADQEKEEGIFHVERVQRGWRRGSGWTLIRVEAPLRTIIFPFCYSRSLPEGAVAPLALARVSLGLSFPSLCRLHSVRGRRLRRVR